MKGLNISLVAMLLLALGSAQEGLAQGEKSYYFHPKLGPKHPRVKPYVDTAEVTRTVTEEVTIVADTTALPMPVPEPAKEAPAKPEETPALPPATPALPSEK